MTIPAFFGAYGSTAIPYVSHMADVGANALWFHGFDAAAFEACEHNGLAACVEFKTFRADFDKRPELIATGVDGRPIRYGELVQGVCLSRDEFLAETEKNLIDGLRDFRPAGIWLDYLTFGGWFETPEPDLQESCFCKECVYDFCNSTGIDASSPEIILRDHSLQWTKYKTERIAGFAAHYAGLIRTALPDCVVGAYMCPWIPDEFEGALSRIFAQDYNLMAPAIDIFTPLIYVKKSGRAAEWGRNWLEQSSQFVPSTSKMQLILDVLDFPDSLLAAAAASNPSWGIQLFGGGQVFMDSEKARTFGKVVEQLLGNL